jgi:N-acetyl-alpha-D-muramate 1-phosphate uridylyltransferase
MNAMIFAAGLGTRLYPLTENCPKALVEINGKPLLWYAIKNVTDAGATLVVVNVHHFASQVIDYIDSKPFANSNVEILISDEQDELLETGGGLLKAASLFRPNQPILIFNSDVLTNTDLKQLIAFHSERKGLATLMVEKRKTSRYFLFDDKGQLVGWENQSSGERRLVRDVPEYENLAFDGVQIVEYKILNMLGEVHKFSITNGYLDLAKDEKICCWHQWTGQWFDVGTPEKLDAATKRFDFSKFT